MLSEIMSASFVSRTLPNGVLIEFKAPYLDEFHAPGLAEELIGYATGPGRTLYLNFNNVRAVCRDVWLQLILLHQHLQQEGRRLCILNLIPRLRDEFHQVERSELEDGDGFVRTFLYD